MAKNYLCKDCIHNNNGWCKLHEKQGLKQINQCKDKKTKENTKNTDEKINEVNSEALINFGKRDFLYGVQRQLLAMEDEYGSSEVYLEVIRILVSLTDMLLVSEGIHGIDFDGFEINEDIYKSSININEYWKNKFNITDMIIKQ